MNGFVGVGMGGDIVEKAVSGSEVKLGGVGLVRGELTNSGEDGEVYGRRRARTQPCFGSKSSPLARQGVTRWWRVKGVRARRCGKREKCRWQGRRQNHNPKDKEETA